MKFSTREDVDAPIQVVFEALTEFETFERLAMRRGAEVRRTDQLAAPGLGMSWNASFRLRGKQRKMALEVVRFERPNEIAIDAVSPSIHADFAIELMALSRSRTRMTIGLEITPKTLPARLVVQSLRLTKAKLTKRYKLRVAEYVKGMEDRLRLTT